MKSHDLQSILNSQPQHKASGSRQGSFWSMDPFDGGGTWIGKWVGESPWERHQKGEEFLYVLKGEVEVTLITPEGKRSALVREGSVFVVPRNHWHKQKAGSEVVVVGATPGVTEHSEAEPIGF